MFYLTQPGPTLSNRFAWLMGGLVFYLGRIFDRDRARGPLTLVIHRRLRRLERRFLALVARFEAGTLRPARVRHAAVARVATVRAPRVLPGGFGWLCRLMPEGHEFAAYLSDAYLAGADAAALLLAAPQAGGVVRALLWMTGRPVPEMLRLPARAPRPPRPSRAMPKRPGLFDPPNPPYREQAYGSHYPRSMWPSKADLERVDRRLAREAWRAEQAAKRALRRTPSGG